MYRGDLSSDDDDDDVDDLYHAEKRKRSGDKQDTTRGLDSHLSKSVAPTETDKDDASQTSHEVRGGKRVHSEAPGSVPSRALNALADAAQRGLHDEATVDLESKTDGYIEHGKGKKVSTEKRRREERNQREKERSFRITQQINELKDLLVKSGVMVARGTKSSVLSEAASYIRMLQQQQQQIELHRRQFLRDVNRSTAFGFPATAAVPQMATSSQPQPSGIPGLTLVPLAANVPQQQAAAQQLANLATIATASSVRPPQQAVLSEMPSTATTASSATATTASTGAAGGQIAPPTALANAARDLAISASLAHQREVDHDDYKVVFESCNSPMAIANLGGTFLDCNKLFRQTTGHSKEELASMTIFNLTHRQDLQIAFDSLTKMITSPLVALGLAPGNVDESSDTFTLMGTMPGSSNKGLRIDAVKNDQGTLRCLCITLIDMAVTGL
uniref:BHLH domain-containing protein n=1 Tax=Grammatophora oceanica TaxID=210454 RepID=A0A7S1UM68_9STRA|mmetsp:Transcript_11801/g.17331  ORF Transcript_11801/g.17331 Transcript_11801/m.17331 type:complete len:445 (+) Transcript_11801:187-1521(+)|eukprot:CAMPEP_0194033778 /NCGR_PEP_ID=MMETSP0009_2-20130614/6321_1 /TAXON_ID=210454 /ORGANISM="Grammatophora oceanica, Strain CCMP 410" /LENGTH=444 /DNA_ID=CAMNT_0038674501 /DNA_START=135 /DNA_END=1469 /DNA_ORIENTATION=+